MKNRTLVLIFLMLFSSMCVNAQNDKVQLIAVHMGNVDNMSALDKATFPDFEYYYNDADLIGYNEAQKLMGNPKNLVGWYGELPEKMGFCANYTGPKGKYFAHPYSAGAIFVIDPAGTVSYQMKPNAKPDQIGEALYSVVKKLKKGKLTKPLKLKAQEYIKTAPVGQIERSKKSDIDKDGEGIIGWQVPDITIKDEKGESISLKDLSKDKITVIVFYTLNGAKWKMGDTKGNIEKEWDGKLLLAPSAYNANVNNKINDGEYASKSKAKMGFAKTMFKTGVANSNLGLAKMLINSKEELNDVERKNAYERAVRFMFAVQDISGKLKK